MDVEVEVKQSITELFQTKHEICASNTLSCKSTIQSQSSLSRTWPLLHVCFQHTLKCENPWGLSKVDGFISVHRGNTHKLDQHFDVIFLRPTHVSRSPTSDTALSDQMWLTSSGAGTLNSSVTPLRRFFSTVFMLSSLVVKQNKLPDWCVKGYWRPRFYENSLTLNSVFITLPWKPFQSSGSVFYIH